MAGLTASAAAGAAGTAALGGVWAPDVRVHTQLISETSRMMHRSPANTVPRPISTTNKLE